MRGCRRWSVTTAPGVYAIYEADRLLYIGQAVNLRKRLISHVNSFRWKQGLTFKIAVTLFGLTTRERRLIERLAPPHNREWNPRRRPMTSHITDFQTFGSLR